MARTQVALNIPVGVTVCAKSGNCYRPDESGIVQAETTDVAELLARGDVAVTQTTAAQMGASTKHKGSSLSTARSD